MYLVMLLLEEQINDNMFSTGSCLSILIPLNRSADFLKIGSHKLHSL